jgi:hypothetical protein
MFAPPGESRFPERAEKAQGMRHFHRTHLPPSEILSSADTFFTQLGMEQTLSVGRTRTYQGALGTLELSVRMEGGHYTMVEATTDQMGESRLDRNVKRFFVRVHKKVEPGHAIDAAY